MKKSLLLNFAFLIIGLSSLKAQITPACPSPPPPGAPSCQTTCVYCDFDGYMGNNMGTPSGGNIVCNQITIHNDQWFGFVAATSTISIDILTSNCANGDGLQSAFFDNCQDDAIVCNPGVGGGAGMPLNLTYTNFVPGQTYYLMIDGYIADVCDFEIDVIQGSIVPPAPAPPDQPSGPTQVCPGATAEYTIPEAFGAGYYTWTTPPGSSINGGPNVAILPPATGTTITVTFGSQGGNVCVSTGSACNGSTPSACLPITNQPIPPTVKPDVLICFDELPFIWDEAPFVAINTAGTFNLTSSPYQSYLGCDSLIKQKITVKSLITKNIGTQNICSDECFILNNNTYCNQGGPFQEIFTSWQGCDSIVTFSIFKLPAVASIQQPIPLINCNNPVLTLNGSGSTTGPNVVYSWTSANWSPIGSQSTQTITNGGTYHFVVSNSSGPKVCRDTVSVTVSGNTNPPGVSAAGGVIGCLATNQSVTLMANSPTSGVNFFWTGPGITPANQNQQNPTVTTPGNYTVQVTNPTNFCTSTQTVTVIADNTPPSASAQSPAISCSSATVTIDLSANVANAAFNWSGPGINPGNQNIEDPSVNTSGTYNVTVTNNVNGCTSTTSVFVDQNIDPPTANAGPDQTINCFQNMVTLDGMGTAPNGASVSFGWNGPGINVSNQNLANPAVDQAGTYVLTVTNLSNNCILTDTVLVLASTNPPTALAGADDTLTCASANIVLNSAGSSIGANFSALWAGPGITPLNQNQYNPSINQPGNYTITIINNLNGCTATDTVLLSQDVSAPTADAGLDQTLTCGTVNGVVLNGGSMPANVLYLWTGPGIGANNNTLPNPAVTVDGVYTLQVTNPSNGCTATDQVEVFQDSNVPEADAGQDLYLNCSVLNVNFDASGSASGSDITYLWSGPGINPANDTLQNPSGITIPGTYNLTVTNTSNNCVNTDVLVVLMDTIAPNAVAGADLTLNCFNNGADTLHAAGTSSGNNFQILWSGPAINLGNQNAPNPVINQPGMYTLVVTNTTNTCTASDQVMANLDIAPPNAAAGLDATINCVTTSTNLGGNSSSGAQFTYAWSGPSITPVNTGQSMPNVNLPGIYTITVTNTQNGCTASDEVMVTLDAVYPNTSAGPDQTIICTQLMLVLDATASSNGPEYQYLWTGPGITPANQNQAAPTIGSPGTYILNITNTNNNCQIADTVVVDENTAAPMASAGADLVLNCQTLQVVLNGSASTSGAGIQYLWSGPDIGASNETIQNPTITQPGNYTLLVTNTANGCTAEDFVQVNQDVLLPIADAGADLTLTCSQNIQTINGSASSTGNNIDYTWQGPGINTGNYNLQNPMVSDSGLYVIIVTNTANHCTASDQVYVALDGDFPLTDAGPSQTLTCNINQVQLDGSLSVSGPGIAYLWSGPGLLPGTETSLTPTATQSGQYTLLVTNNNNGCSQTDAVQVDADLLAPIADAGSDLAITCASINGVNISSLGSTSNQNFSVLWSGPDITAANEMDAEPLVVIPGLYTLTLTNALNGCTATDQVLVTQDQNIPLASAGADQVIDCNTSQVSLDGSGSQTGGLFDVLWSGPGINTANQAEVTPLVSEPGNYTVVITNNQTGCSASDDVVVSLDLAAPVLTLSADTINCANFTAMVSSSSSIPGSTFLWQGPGVPFGTQNLPLITVQSSGLYTLLVTAPNGCTATSTIVVEEDANLPDGAAEGTVLNCFNNGISAIIGEVNTPNATYSWSGPGNFSSNLLNPTVTLPGTYLFTIVANNGCQRTIDVTVVGNLTAPTALANAPNTLDCNTPTVVINGLGSSTGNNIQYQWTTSVGNILSGANGLNPMVNAPGTYTLLVSNTQNGCTSTASVVAANDPSVPSAMNLDVKDVPCFDQNTGIIVVSSVNGGTPPFLYSIDGAPASNTAQFINLTAGTYSIRLEDAHGCVLDTLVDIASPEQLLVELGDDIDIQLGEYATIGAIIAAPTTPVATVVWSPAAPCDTIPNAPTCLSYTIQPEASYRQSITVYDENGCIASDQILVQVRKDRHIYVPSIFNPNSDNPLNTILMINGNISIEQINYWSIYDRWGENVWAAENFQADDPSYAWDGRLRGKDLPPGVYIWVAEVLFKDGETQLFKGDVSIVR